VIAGPCVIEDPVLVLETAAALREICGRVGVSHVFKSSFDKANRSSGASARGPGIHKGLGVLARVKQDVRSLLTTDVHLPDQAKPAAEVVDLLQIPAFLCRQTDLLLACADTGKPVNIKKGQFLAPWDMRSIVEKIPHTELMVTERGTTFGYNQLVVDFCSLPELRKLGVPVCFDATHATQLPGAEGNQSGGRREHAWNLARAAVAVGVDALFFEVHPHPERAWSDASTQLPLASFEQHLREVVAIHRLVHGVANP